MNLFRTLRRVRPIPEDSRCNINPDCPGEAVMHSGPVHGQGPETRRCLDHPPDAALDQPAKKEA